MSKTEFDLVVVSNRLPVDITSHENNQIEWTRSPGGLVTALDPIMRNAEAAWVGWSGAPGLQLDPFDADGTFLVPVELSKTEVEQYYEGFSNDTLWPLYHDVIAQPAYHRAWWEAYKRVNARFAHAAAQQAAPGAQVWVQDYQLQLVPALLRQLRPDLSIGFFNHIPFPPFELFQQLPWRRHILDGLLGADVIGFQRPTDAANFRRCVTALTAIKARSEKFSVAEAEGHRRTVQASAFPISIDSKSFTALAKRKSVQLRARQIREELGNPKVVMLGVDRLDYTKGIRHRIKAYGELLLDQRIAPSDCTLIQVASPSRENVEAYQELREQVEILVGRLNGEYGELGHTAIHYMHHSYPQDEMAALYLAADVMLVTSLRDGMNLVAKEYVAARHDLGGALVLSEFTGAADELTGAIMVNPHDIDGMKDAMLAAAHMTVEERRRRMLRLRRKVMTNNVDKWSKLFLGTLTALGSENQAAAEAVKPNESSVSSARTPTEAPHP